MRFIELLKLILASFGGAAIALIGLSKWLGKVWANKILEKEKAKHARELEGYKSELALGVDKSSRYSESQFDLYNSLWEALYDLKVASDSLWDEATLKNLKSFTSRLTNAEKMIQKRSLLIEEEHHRELMALIEQLDDFRIGKERLINLRKGSYVRLTSYGSKYVDREIEQVIEHNRHVRDQYNALVNNIQASLRKQLRGDLAAA
jgi:hypothetical protein